MEKFNCTFSPLKIKKNFLAAIFFLCTVVLANPNTHILAFIGKYIYAWMYVCAFIISLSRNRFAATLNDYFQLPVIARNAIACS